MVSFVDTHTHLYLEQFDNDRAETVQKAIDLGVKKMLLPNVDEQTIDPLLQLHRQFPENCLPMMGLHPTSVKPGFEAILERMKLLFKEEKFYAVGETGIDLYWDKTHAREQVTSFEIQIGWAIEMDLPVVIHSRNSVAEIIDILEKYRNRGLKGVMHCFPGNAAQAKWFTEFGLLLGIGGVVTYKKSEMADVVAAIPVEYLLLETDSPYLPPVPHRGKRNESGFIPLIAAKIAEIKNMPVAEIAVITAHTSNTLFKINQNGNDQKS